MQNDTFELLHKIVVISFVVTWIFLGVTGVIFFRINKDVAFKRKWFPRFNILLGVLFLIFSNTGMVLASRSLASLRMLVIEVPFVALIAYFNIRFTKFCDRCGGYGSPAELVFSAAILHEMRR